MPCCSASPICAAGIAGSPKAACSTKGPKPGQGCGSTCRPSVRGRSRLAAAAGLAGLAVEAGAVLLLDRAEAIRAADARAFALEGLERARHAPTGAARARMMRYPRGSSGACAPAVATVPTSPRASPPLLGLAPFRTGSAVLVARAYILAVAAGETVAAMLDRTRALGNGASAPGAGSACSRAAGSTRRMPSPARMRPGRGCRGGAARPCGGAGAGRRGRRRACCASCALRGCGTAGGRARPVPAGLPHRRRGCPRGCHAGARAATGTGA